MSTNDKSLDPSLTEDPLFKRQKKTVLSHEIYIVIRNAILEGRLEQGERIVESNIAEQMGVSRAPLREALRQLESDGLLEVATHRETRVISLSTHDIQELHLIRMVLETLAYQYAAQRITPDELAEVESLVLNIEKAAVEGDAKALAKYDYAFHETLCKTSGMPRIYDIWSDQHVLLRLWLNVVARSYEDEMPSTAASHRKIFEAIRSKNGKQITEEVFHHIYHSGPIFIKERAQWAEEAAQTLSLFANSFDGILTIATDRQSNYSPAI